MSSAPNLTVLRFSRVVTSIISGSVVKSTDCTEIITDTESRSGPRGGQGRSPRKIEKQWSGSVLGQGQTFCTRTVHILIAAFEILITSFNLVLNPFIKIKKNKK